MFLVGLISWWYGRGWVGQWARMATRFRSTLDFFSVGQLAATLFSPFRQISAGTSGDKSLGGVLRSMVDQLISRCIGALVRTFTIIAGLVVIAAQGIYELCIMLVWWFVPLLPLAGFVLLAIGWTPSWM